MTRVAKRQPQRRAIVVGINAYPEPYTLQGCVDDADRWMAWLVSRHFQVRQITDASATARTITDALLDLIGQSQRGDVLAFVYSGHGTRVRDLNGDEADGWDEAMVPVDFLHGALITDDDLGAILAQLPNGVAMTVVADSCYSGTITRLISGPMLGADTPAARPGLRHRYITLPLAARAAYVRERALDAEQPGSSRYVPPAPLPATVTTVPGVGWVTISACRDTEVSWEAEGDDGTVGGLFTRAATDVLTRAGSTLYYPALVSRTLLAMGGLDAPQHPTLEGPTWGITRRTIVSPAPFIVRPTV